MTEKEKAEIFNKLNNLIESNNNTSPRNEQPNHFRNVTEFSMKSMGKENYLDYTFLSHRNIISEKPQKKQLKEYIYDLHNTLDLNMQLLEMTINNYNYSKNDNEKRELIQIFNKFKQNYINKNKKRAILHDTEAKVLISKQILSEIQRKIEETNEYYREQFRDNEENHDSKEEYIKIFEKKLQEVEIYVHKHTKELTNSPYEKYKNWRMNDFLEVNNKLTATKDLLTKDMIKIKKNIEEVKEENKIYQDETNQEAINNSQINHNDENDKKVKAYVEHYRKQIRVIQMRMKLIKNCFDNMSKTMSYLRFDKRKILKKNILSNGNGEESVNNNIIRNGKDLNSTANFGNEDETNNNKHNNIINNAKENNKSILQLDLTRKINIMMDFSILNKKGDETKFDDLGKTGMNPLGNVTNLNMWDISVINK